MTNAELAARLRHAIARSGKTKARVAREAPIDPGHLRKLLSGRVAIGRGKAEAIAAVLAPTTASYLLGVDGGENVAVAEPSSPYETNVERFGQWMLGLPEDVRSFTYFMGEVLRKRDGLGRFAAIAAESLARMEQSTPAEAGTSRKRSAAATRAARQKKASGR